MNAKVTQVVEARTSVLVPEMSWQKIKILSLAEMKSATL